MASPPTNPKAKINLERATVLLMEASPQGMDILVQVLNGFGVRTPLRAMSGASAMEMVKSHLLDLIIVDAQLSDMEGYEFVKWLRTSKIEPLSNPTAMSVVENLCMFASDLKGYGEANKFHDICNLADALSGEAAKTLYLLTLS